MKKFAALVIGFGMSITISQSVFAESLWCEIKHRVCDQGSTNSVCITARANCPN